MCDQVINDLRTGVVYMLSLRTSGTLHSSVLSVLNLKLFLARILLLGLSAASSRNQNDLCGWFGELCYAISQEQ